MKNRLYTDSPTTQMPSSERSFSARGLRPNNVTTNIEGRAVVSTEKGARKQVANAIAGSGATKAHAEAE